MVNVFHIFTLTPFFVAGSIFDDFSALMAASSTALYAEAFAIRVSATEPFSVMSAEIISVPRLEPPCDICFSCGGRFVNAPIRTIFGSTTPSPGPTRSPSRTAALDGGTSAGAGRASAGAGLASATLTGGSVGLGGGGGGSVGLLAGLSATTFVGAGCSATFRSSTGWFGATETGACAGWALAQPSAGTGTVGFFAAVRSSCCFSAARRFASASTAVGAMIFVGADAAGAAAGCVGCGAGAGAEDDATGGAGAGAGSGFFRGTKTPTAA